MSHRPGESMAVRIWNESGGLDWHSLPLLVDLHGVTDVETLIAELMAIRGFLEERNG